MSSSLASVRNTFSFTHEIPDAQSQEECINGTLRKISSLVVIVDDETGLARTHLYKLKKKNVYH